MSNPKFSSLFRVEIKKFNPGVEAGEVETYLESTNVIAQDIEEALALGKDYAELLNSNGSWSFYEITAAYKVQENVFIGLEEEMYEVEIAPEGQGVLFPSGEERSI